MAWHLLSTVNAIIFISISLISWILILSNMTQTLPTLTNSNYTRACSTTLSPRMGCWFPLLLGLLSKFPFNSLFACLPVLTDRWESYSCYPSLDMKGISASFLGLSFPQSLAGGGGWLGPGHISPPPPTPGSRFRDDFNHMKSVWGTASAMPPVDRRGQQCVGKPLWSLREELRRARGRGLPRILCVGLEEDCLY